MYRTLCLALISILTARGAGAQEEKPSPLRLRLKDENAQDAELWIYNDIERARKEARRQGKPLFVTFRCVPCASCKSFDAEVAGGNHAVQELARERFISVRQVEMKNVDLSLFEFDYDLNWAAMFVHPDGTVLGRYGTQSAEGPDAYNSMRGLELAMKRVLKLHDEYPANAEELKGKRRDRKSYTAFDLPGLERKDLYRGETSRKNCIHCHNIHDARNQHAQKTGQFQPEMLWRFPLPENIGLSMDREIGVRIRSVTEGAPAQQAGLRSGLDITHVEGQAIISIADIQWALHRLPTGDTRVRVTTSGDREYVLELESGWKKTDISWRGSNWSISPKLRVWTPPPNARERKRYSIPEDQHCLVVRWINTGSPAGRSANQAGLKKGDAIIAVGGKSLPETPAKFNLWIKLNYKVGEKLPLTVLRHGKKKTLSIPLVE